MGTAFAFISQIALTAGVWQSHVLWLWWSICKSCLTIRGLNAIFGADRSFLSLFNREILRNFRVGWLIAMFAWYGSFLLVVFTSGKIGRGTLMPCMAQVPRFAGLLH
jgi:hypothetical protein